LGSQFEKKMRYLINYLRQAFCKHDFEYHEKEGVTDYKGVGTKVYMRCKKCGYHQNHWKFL